MKEKFILLSTPELALTVAIYLHEKHGYTLASNITTKVQLSCPFNTYLTKSRNLVLKLDNRHVAWQASDSDSLKYKDAPRFDTLEGATGWLDSYLLAPEAYVGGERLRFNKTGISIGKDTLPWPKLQSIMKYAKEQNYFKV